MFFFFKQKTAYEMRISDWSSDVVLFRSQPRLGHRFGELGTGERHVLGPAVPEQRHHFGQREPAVGRPLHQREQRPQLFFGRDQRAKARPQHERCTSTRTLLLAAPGVRSPTTVPGPELQPVAVTLGTRRVHTSKYRWSTSPK